MSNFHSLSIVMPPLFNTCLINNFNNQHYLKACLDSVFSQTHPFDKVVVVDDGSSDQSLDILKAYQACNPRLEVLKKSNGGQLSAFNFSVSSIPDRGQIFLLDSDDLYPTDYLEVVLKAFNYKSWDFAFCEHSSFFIDSDSLSSAKINSENKIDFKKTSALVRSRHFWIGNITSTISLSGNLFHHVFPYPVAENQVLWTDNILIYATSILGFTKTHLPSISISWRSHDKNDSKNPHSEKYLAKKDADIERVISYYSQRAGVDRYPSITEFYSELSGFPISWKKRVNLPNHWRIFNRLIRGRLLIGYNFLKSFFNE